MVGPNGQGKTNLLEALGWLATLGSFRGAAPDVLIRDGAPRAVLRAEGDRAGRAIQLEAELPRVGRHRVQLNRQKLTKARDLLGVVRVSVFTPDDLALVKEGPSGRRAFLDTTLVALDPRLDAVVREVDRVLRQRNALLRQLGGRLKPDAEVTLDVWDAKLADAGEALARARLDLVAQLGPLVSERYASLASAATPVALGYHPSWLETGLAASLAAGRAADVARGVSQIGPHRDDLAVDLAGTAARSHASQGEQRSLALALKLAAHRLVTERVGVPPLLLLDDVFSELDPKRRAALIELLPGTQSLLTSADRLPEGSHPDLVYRVDDGRIEAASMGTRW